jgi:hypothetical protein
MLQACMIDGFGWFEEADYRRSWLFFDQVDYVLPEGAEGPLIYPRWILQRPDYRVAYPPLSADQVARITESAASDACDRSFRQLIEGIVPPKDLDYAMLVLASDKSLWRETPQELKRDSVFALLVLVNKLIVARESQ